MNLEQWNEKQMNIILWLMVRRHMDQIEATLWVATRFSRKYTR